MQPEVTYNGGIGAHHTAVDVAVMLLHGLAVVFAKYRRNDQYTTTRALLFCFCLEIKYMSNVFQPHACYNSSRHYVMSLPRPLSQMSSIAELTNSGDFLLECYEATETSFDSRLWRSLSDSCYCTPLNEHTPVLQTAQ